MTFTTQLQQRRIYLPRRGATAWECQFGSLGIRWCFLYGGHWRHWWQPSRLKMYWAPRKDGYDRIVWEWCPDEVWLAVRRRWWRLRRRMAL